MPLFYLRHGESEANIRNLFAGQKDDSPLSPLGIKQARQAAKEINDIDIDRIISSKLIRAQQTAILVAKYINFDLNNIENDDRIIEYDMGALTGTPIRKVSSQELVLAEGAENPLEFRNRILSFLKEHQNNPQNILVVSHAGVGRAIEAARQNIDPSDFYGLDAYPNTHSFELDLSWLT